MHPTHTMPARASHSRCPDRADKRAPILGALLLPLTVWLASCTTTTGPAITGDDASAAISGSLNYREQVSLAPGARAHVTLSNRAGEVLAEQVINIRGQVPIAFLIAYDPEVVNQEQTHFLEAQILLANGAIGWSSAVPVAVFAGQPSTGLELQLPVAGYHSDSTAEFGDGPRSFSLHCDELHGQLLIGEGRATLILPDRGVSLGQVPSASGSKYQDTNTVLWSKGRQATLEFDGRILQECTLSPG